MHYLFDMDGVLVCSEPVTFHAAVTVLKDYGISAVREDFAPFIGAGEARFVGGVAEKYGVAYEPAMKERLYDYYLQYVKTELTLFPDTKRVLAQLKERGHKIALSSSADMIKIQANMQVAGIPLDWFDALTCGDDAERKKPFPDIFLETAKRLGANPADCLVVEDALNGIQAAKSAGMHCAAVTSYFSREQLMAEAPDAVIDSLSELLTLSL